MNRQPAKEMLDWHGSGMSVMEMTHRGAVCLGLFEKAKADFCRLLNLPDHYKVLFMQGGASAQNALVFVAPDSMASPINTSPSDLQRTRAAQKGVW